VVSIGRPVESFYPPLPAPIQELRTSLYSERKKLDGPLDHSVNVTDLYIPIYMSARLNNGRLGTAPFPDLDRLQMRSV
jgi:hypothetical protein